MANEFPKSQITIVPWFNKEEWEDVYKKLYSKNSADLKFALDRISAWSSRSHPSLSLGIEATAAIVRAKLEDASSNASNRHNARVLFSMALVRFVNLVSELGQLKRFATPVREAAAKVGIPEWIVDLRHKATHGQMPSLNMLRTSTELAMEWLRLNYWEKERMSMRDWRIDPNFSTSSVDEEIKALVTTFQQHRYEILYGKHLKGEKESKKAVQRDILQNIDIIVKKHRTTFIKKLMEPGFLIPRQNHLEALLSPEESDFLRDESTCLPRSLERFWKPILRLFNNSKSLQVLLESLLAVRDPLAQRLATAWVEMFLDLITNDGTNSAVYASPLASVFRQEYTLDWLPLLKIGLKSPNNYTPKVLSRIAQQVGACNSHLAHSLMALVAIYLGATVEDSPTKNGNLQRIFTVRDLTAVRSVPTKAENTKGPWQMCEDHVDWGRYPIGIVPDSNFTEPSSANIHADITVDDCASSIHSLYRQSSIEDEVPEHEVFDVDDLDCMEEEMHLEKQMDFTCKSFTCVM